MVLCCTGVKCEGLYKSVSVVSDTSDMNTVYSTSLEGRAVTGLFLVDFHMIAV